MRGNELQKLQSLQNRPADVFGSRAELLSPSRHKGFRHGMWDLASHNGVSPRDISPHHVGSRHVRGIGSRPALRDLGGFRHMALRHMESRHRASRHMGRVWESMVNFMGVARESTTRSGTRSGPRACFVIICNFCNSFPLKVVEFGRVRVCSNL